MLCSLSLIGASACTQGLNLVADVRSASGEPISGAVVSCVCEPRGSAVAESDARGTATLAIDENTELERCTVTAAADQFRTQQLILDRPESKPLSFTLEPQ